MLDLLKKLFNHILPENQSNVAIKIIALVISIVVTYPLWIICVKGLLTLITWKTVIAVVVVATASFCFSSAETAFNKITEHSKLEDFPNGIDENCCVSPRKRPLAEAINSKTVRMAQIAEECSDPSFGSRPKRWFRYFFSKLYHSCYVYSANDWPAQYQLNNTDLTLTFLLVANNIVNISGALWIASTLISDNPSLANAFTAVAAPIPVIFFGEIVAKTFAFHKPVTFFVYQSIYIAGFSWIFQIFHKGWFIDNLQNKIFSYVNRTNS